MLNTKKHKDILIRILKDIYTEVEIGPYLGFKGGTAAMIFYGLNRFSVDLDFDLLDTSKQDYIFESLPTILKKYGTIKEEYNKRSTIFFLLSYEKDALNIKIEINKRNFNSHYEIKKYLGISMKVMVQADMAAHKIVAMHERLGKANRDIYDVWFFLHNNWPINHEIVELRTAMDFYSFLQKCIDDLEKMSNKNILSGMGELLDANQKAWVKAHLKNEVIFLLKLALNK